MVYKQVICLHHLSIVDVIKVFVLVVLIIIYKTCFSYKK